MIMVEIYTLLLLDLSCLIKLHIVYRLGSVIVGGASTNHMPTGSISHQHIHRLEP